MGCDERGLGKFAGRYEPKEGRTLVVGSKCYGDKLDRRRLYQEAVGLDLFEGDGVDFVHDMEKPLPSSQGQFDHVDCVSVLEHVRRPWRMAENIEAALVPGGTLLVCVPFVWRVHAYPSDFWRMTAEALEVLFPSIEWLGRCYLVNGKLKEGVKGKHDAAGQWMQRAELAGWGVKCG
jgi:SAM-dependent methyltransferase